MIVGAVAGAVWYLAARLASSGDPHGVLLFVLSGPLLLLFAALRSDGGVAGVAIPMELTLGTLIIGNLSRDTRPTLVDIGWTTANIGFAFGLAVAVNAALAPDRAMDAGLTLLSASLVQIGAGVSTAASSLLHRPGGAGGGAAAAGQAPTVAGAADGGGGGKGGSGPASGVGGGAGVLAGVPTKPAAGVPLYALDDWSDL
ncbi:hypothetical protein BU14_3139s0001, partial [Porphyra umbilicalis]